MQQEYTYSRGWQIFIYSFLTCLMAGIFYLFYRAAQPGENLWLMLGLGVGLMVFAGYCFLDVKRRLTIVSDFSIIQVTAFKRREIACADVEGYCIEKNHIYISSRSGKKTAVVIDSFSYLGNHEELVGWLAERFDDLDEETYSQELNEILDDTELGPTEEDRATILNQVKKLCTWVNGIAGVVAIWLFVYPYPYDLAIITAMVIPLIALFFQYKYRVIVRIFAGDKSAYPSLSTAIFSPLLGLLVRIISDYDLINWTDCVVPIISAAVIILLLLGATWMNALRNMPKKAGETLLGLALFALAYAYTGTIAINCDFDYSPSQLHAVKVLSQRFSNGKHTSYYLTLSQWGPKADGEEVTVSKPLYNNVKVGDVVQVHIKNGLFNIHWYYVTQ